MFLNKSTKHLLNYSIFNTASVETAPLAFTKKKILFRKKILQCDDACNSNKDTIASIIIRAFLS